MKRQWQTDELLECWTLHPQEQELLVGKKPNNNRLAFALLLKFFQIEGSFPQQRQEIPLVVQEFVAQNLGLSGDILHNYDWLGRTAIRYRNQIHEHFGFREVTAAGYTLLKQWLIDEILAQQQEENRLFLLLREHLRMLQIELPTSEQIKRLIHSARHQYEQQLFAQIVANLSPECCQKLDGLLENEDEAQTQTETKSSRRLHLFDLKSNPGRASV